MNPLITAVLPAYRMGAYMEGALDSIAAQSYTNWEVVVVDDQAPEDGTHAIVKRFAERMPKHRVELMVHERNQGVSAARNTGIAAARGEFIAFLDPDDLWKSDHLERCMEQFRKREDLDVCTGPVEVFSEGDVEAQKFYSQDAWYRRNFPYSLGLDNYIQPSASVVRRSTLEAVGGFDTEPSLQHIEDYDLWIRLVEGGWRFALLSEPTTRYRKHSGGATSDVAKMKALDTRLVQRHLGFFRRANAMLCRLAHEDQLRSERELVELRIRYNGPIMRSILGLDSLLRRSFAAITGRSVKRNGN